LQLIGLGAVDRIAHYVHFFATAGQVHAHNTWRWMVGSPGEIYI
jgi:hypothetical protein